MLKWKRLKGGDEGGWIEVTPDGTISINVDDDWYSGVLSKEQTRELFDKLCGLYDVIQESIDRRPIPKKPVVTENGMRMFNVGPDVLCGHCASPCGGKGSIFGGMRICAGCTAKL